MKKLFFMPVFVLFLSGTVSNGEQHKTPNFEPVIDPISVKLDSINVKTAELNELIKQL